MEKHPPEVFCEKSCFENFAKLTGKHLCQSPFFNEVAGRRFVALLKKKTPTQMFSCKFYEIFQNTFFTEHLQVTTSVNVELDNIFHKNFIYKSGNANLEN